MGNPISIAYSNYRDDGVENKTKFDVLDSKLSNSFVFVEKA